MTPQIRPCDDAGPLQQYIDTYWRRGHVLARERGMFDFTYCTPWVDKRRFPSGISVLGLYDGARMIGFLGAIVAPYPRPQSYWLALWHVLPELKGGGHGGKLLQAMQEIAEGSDGWIGTFGAGPEALPVYLKRGYCVRAARRWIYASNESSAACSGPTRSGSAMGTTNAAPLNTAECEPDRKWLDYRYHRHPIYTYDVRPRGVFRSEDNDWGRVTHACWLASDGRGEVAAVYADESARAARNGQRYLMDAWAFDAPGAGWALAPQDLPSVFHPVEARGNVTYAVGRPFIVSRIHKGDCDQDRPNTGDVVAGHAVGHVVLPTG